MTIALFAYHSTHRHFLDVEGMKRGRANNHLKPLSVVGDLGDLLMKSVDQVAVPLRQQSILPHESVL